MNGAYLSTLLRYLSSRSAKISQEQLKKALDKKFREEGETIMATIAETLIEQGREEMRQKMDEEIQKARQEMEQEVRRAHQEAQRAHQEAQAEKQRGGLLSSIELGLELKFGEEGLRLFNEVQQVQETSLLSYPLSVPRSSSSAT